MNWDWPGNVRELRNVLERSSIFCEGPEVGASDLPPLQASSSARRSGAEAWDDAFPIPQGLSLAEAEAQYIRYSLQALDGNVQRTAESLGISRKNLWEKRKKYDLLG
jgi:DNA-binding NtrC family response regulator